MEIRRASSIAASALLACLVAPPAAAQFDPLHNHLMYYQMGGKPITVHLQLDNQFGTALALKLKPFLLCLPTQKTCCDPAQPIPCQPIACPSDPSPNQPAAVDHFIISCGSDPAQCASGSCPVGLTCTPTSTDGCICQ